MPNIARFSSVEVERVRKGYQDQDYYYKDDKTTCVCGVEVPHWLSSKEKKEWILDHRVAHLEGKYA